MSLIAVIPIAASLLVASAVGLRLLLLASRTRQLPEFAIGLGLTCIGILGQPIAIAGRLPAMIGTPLGDALFAVGVGIAHVGIGLLFVFTWSVFRRDSRIAGAVLALAWLGLATMAVGLVRAGTGGSDMAEIFPRTRPWAMGSVALVIVCFAWSGCESMRYYRMLRRRLALGLADPIVVNRFGLWVIVGATTTALGTVLLAYSAAGSSPLTEPVPRGLTGLMGLAAACAWYLSFLPPERYLERTRARAHARL